MHKLDTIGDNVITCSVFGCLNNPSKVICEEFMSELIDERTRISIR